MPSSPILPTAWPAGCNLRANSDGVNYRHLYHAGNFADVVKHVVLTLLLQAMARKDTPFVYIETHAGAGRYDLTHPLATKTGEWRDGIGAIWQAADAPAAIAPYLDIVRAQNPTGALRWYPGSPRIASALLRPQDRMVLAELHPEECQRLHAEYARVPRVQVQCQDGFAGLRAWLPPKERRGLVLIDPAYEREAEWREVGQAVTAARRRFATGTYAIWYPIKARSLAGRLTKAFADLPAEKVLHVGFNRYPPDAPLRLNGGGLWILNPPWQLDLPLQAALDWLVKQWGGPPAVWGLQWGVGAIGG